MKKIILILTAITLLYSCNLAGFNQTKVVNDSDQTLIVGSTAVSPGKFVWVSPRLEEDLKSLYRFHYANGEMYIKPKVTISIDLNDIIDSIDET